MGLLKKVIIAGIVLFILFVIIGMFLFGGIIVGMLIAEDSTTSSTEQQNQMIEDRGDFKVVYTPTENYKEYEETFKNSQVYEEIAKTLNSIFALPYDVYINSQECGSINAYYDPNNKNIIMCYELTEYFLKTFYEVDKETAAQKTTDAIIFVFFHELGHALIDVYQLPTTGKEEDAVDQFSTMLLLETEDPEIMDGIISVAEWFYIEGSSQQDLAFWDEHSLSQQRFYNILCWAYGKDPDYFRAIEENEIIPADRLRRCPSEYQQLSTAWATLLDPYSKQANN